VNNEGDVHQHSTDFFAARMPASDSVFTQDSAQRHHIEPQQPRILVVPDFIGAELSRVQG